MGCLTVWSIAHAQSIKPIPLSPDNVIYKTTNTTESEELPRSVKHTPSFIPHSIRATKTISEEALRQYLASKKSPLSDYVATLLDSPYYSTILGICTIEEYSCSVNPYGTNNLWGLMAQGKLLSYSSLGDGIQAINNFLAKAETNGRTTIESFRGWYCASACTNWESTVIQTKDKLEALQ